VACLRGPNSLSASRCSASPGPPSGASPGSVTPLTELTASGVTHHWPAPTDEPADALQRLADRNYGTVRIDWSARRVELAATGQQGGRIATQISLEALRP
jgi:hypothetical protein